MRRANRRAKYMEDKVCNACGSTVCLEIDHIDPLTKVHPIASSTMWGWSDKRLAEEIAKCQVLCQPCHRKKFKSDMLVRRPLVHGTIRAYKNRGCRCDACRVAGSVYNREQRNRRKP